ncbi:unnamed protein product [Closterium sp. Naga37s-1]|nr:unnamed protein product [Closterium sp. Naga37s-1]
MMIELKGMVDSKIKLELKVGRNNSKEKGIVDESRKLKATTLVVGTSSRGIFGIRGRTGVGAYCMKNRPPTVSVYVVLKDKVTACREADSLPGSSSSAPTSPGHMLVASAAPFRHSPSMSAHHQSDRSSTRSSSGVLEPTDSLGFDDAGGDDESATARTNGAQPPGGGCPSSPTGHTAPQPSRAGTWPHHDPAAPSTPDGLPGFQAYSPGLAVPHSMPGASPATPEQQQAFMADLEARMAHATAALAGLPLPDAAATAARGGGNQQAAFGPEGGQFQQQARPEPGGSPRVAAAQGVAREVETAARIGQRGLARSTHAASCLLPSFPNNPSCCASPLHFSPLCAPVCTPPPVPSPPARFLPHCSPPPPPTGPPSHQAGSDGQLECGVQACRGGGLAPCALALHFRPCPPPCSPPCALALFHTKQAATDNFSAARKLGEGGFGTVYSGTLHHTPVAVKLLKSQDSIQAMAEFQQEVEILSQIQHPHVLMLLGCCPDRYVLVYEYLANGSLEDRLLRLNATPPLPWFVRIRIAAEIASSLLILHTRPVPIVHRDLKPGNILLDKNFVAKLGDVGLAKLMPGLSMERTCDRESTPVGTFAYVDPEFQRTGEFGPKSDVYAFGIVLLDLLTGRTPALYEALEVAVENNRNDELMRFLDAGAGTWPQGMPMEISKLAIQCSEMKRRKRPDLETEVMPVLDRMRSVAIKAEEDAKKASLVRPVATAPPCLFCPITQELMVNPVIAADGHTYELVAIQQWLEKSDRSPMTNVRLPSKALVPNRALKSMILDWRETGGSG